MARHPRPVHGAPAMRPRSSDFSNSVEAACSAARQAGPSAPSPSPTKVTGRRASRWREEWQRRLSRTRCWIWRRGSYTKCSGCSWTRPPCRGRSLRRRSGCRSRAKTSVWTSPAPRSRENGAPRRSCSRASRFRWQRHSVSLASTSSLGVRESRGRCCPDAWKRDGALSAASPTSPPMNAESGPSARWSPHWRSMEWLPHR